MPSAAHHATRDTTADTPRIERLGHTIPNVALMLDVGVRTVQRMIASGELKTIRIASRTVRVTDESLRALFADASSEVVR
jgi:excisionase family DNA binding protein